MAHGPAVRRTEDASARVRIGDQVTVDGEAWEIIALGQEHKGRVYGQLASTKRQVRIGRWLQNGG